MNKSELISVTAEKTGLSKAVAGRALDVILDTVVQTVAKGGRVSFVGFGAFKPVPRAARKGKNPRTGEKINIPAVTVPKFSAGATFKTAIAAASKNRRKK
jgi:DNA-binding protein HU-beta